MAQKVRGDRLHGDCEGGHEAAPSVSDEGGRSAPRAVRGCAETAPRAVRGCAETAEGDRMDKMAGEFVTNVASPIIDGGFA